MPIDRYSGSHTIKTTSDVKLDAGDDIQLTSQDNIELTATDHVLITAQSGDADIALEAGDDIRLTAADNIELTAADDVRVTAESADIELGSGDDIRLTAGDNIALTASGDSVLVSADNDIRLTAEDNFEATAAGTMTLRSTDHMQLTTIQMDIRLDAGDDIQLTSQDNIELTAADDVRLTAQSADIELDAGDDIRLKAEDEIEIDAESQLTLRGTRVNMYTSANSTILSSSTESGASYTILNLQLGGSANTNSNWLRFLDNAGTTKGAIRVARNIATDGGDYAWTSYSQSGSAQYADYNTTLSDDGDIDGKDATTAAGNARFISGNADFGEFFKAGNLAEWPELTRNPSGSADDDGAILGVSEGVVVWVRGNQFFRENLDNNCIPMFVTKRSIITGDGLNLLREDGSKHKGEVLSFCGKLPVLTKGRIREGDYIVPEINTNYCVGIPFDEITFDQYKRAMGRSLGSATETSVLRSDDPEVSGKETEFSIVMCAVGVK